MQTNLTKAFLETPQGQQAESILRACVHCGFCTATCPTYQLLGDELDGPRGRIYLIKQVLEGQKPSKKTRTHLDRCLTCRACETTCPSGVQYAKLLDIGREIVEHQVPRSYFEKFQRYLLRKVIPYSSRFALLLKAGQIIKPVLATSLQKKIPETQAAGVWPKHHHPRKMLILAGCAQQVVAKQTNISSARVLSHLGIELIQVKETGCCGAVSLHLSASDEARIFIKQNINAWWPYIEQGIEAIVSTASGCGVMLKDYAKLLSDDTEYAEKAIKISELTKDISEVLQQEITLPENALSIKQPAGIKVSFHSPCTLQHGLQLNDIVEAILSRCGYELTRVEDSHLCCGSAGTYSILQKSLSNQLLGNKIKNLEHQQPDVIATANIGCQMHLSTAAKTPVLHWIELVEKTLDQKL
ncbi:Glycolate dehydrogenase, iron-sulfur subunit GlcF [hydrothermal vent metagenome]|uniref:Glycolate dehydrogenase, iron-sulfur subunit GlcF n=1 Tax=hydrothermal vent metagenome TaxID=652676 RepID=A0A3B0XSB8_9ZZZZ